MTTGLRPYPAYKDSGVEWLGEVPAHWGVRIFRRILRPFDGIKIGPFGSQLKLDQIVNQGYKVYGQANVIRNDFSYGKKFINDVKFKDLRACEILPGDLVLTMMGTSGRCAIVPEDSVQGIMDSHLLRVRLTESVEPSFVARLVDKAPYVKDQIQIAGKGSIMHGLNSAIIKNLTFALPPMPEQTAIVRYLDYVDRRVQRLTRAKRELVTLLKEQKQAIIHRAVTRGLDPDVPMKDSGIEWLGEVPEHWEVRRLKNVSRLIMGQSPASVDCSPERVGLPFLQGCAEFGAHNPQPIQFCRIPSKVATKGSILMSVRAPVGRFNIADQNYGIGRGLCAITPDEIRFSSVFARYGLLTMRHGLAITSTGSTYDAVSTSDVGGQPAILPPLNEQTTIVEYLDRTTTDIDIAIARANREIELLDEYRTRLIADVVTGKLDVREAAAALPEVDPLAAEDETDETGLDESLPETDNINRSRGTVAV